ncbi:MAG: serine hydrolase [Acidobacteriaceae bacterium]|nr:serine hydrolase [Acidobacteriaceae bacterium]
MRKRLRWFVLAALATAAWAQVPSPRPNETNAPAVAAKQGPSERPLTAEDLTAFVDGILPIQLDRSDEAGAVVAVIRDGQAVLKKGYGYSDVEKKTPVDPDVTGFRPGSISKLFTWISIMQLKEQGKLKLDDDVNQYIDFKIREPWGKPVTIRDLMTHRPGFEEAVRDLIQKSPAAPIPLRQYLVENQPAPIFPPGEVPAYSNYGAGLAGYIVQRVSGERYEDYARAHIFEPLGMSRSSFEQPLPKNWGARPTAGYGTAEEKMLPFEIVSPAPAGALTTTGADMIRFAAALLHGGELDGKRILRPETLAEMWTPQFQANLRLPAMCLGFYEEQRNGARWVGHGGDLVAYHSELLLQPETKTAFFVSYNSAGAGRGASIERPEFFHQFADRYFGPAQAPATVPKQAGTPAREAAGSYWSTRRGVENRLQFLNLLDQHEVSADKDGNLVMGDSKSISGETIPWKPAGRDLWVYPEGQSYLAAIRDSSNRIVRLAPGFPAMQFERVPWYASSQPNLWALGLSLFTFVCVIWTAVQRWRQRKLRPRAEAALRRNRAAQIAAGILWIGITAVVVIFSAEVAGPATFPPSHRFDTVFVALNIVVAVAMLFSALAIAAALWTWRRLPAGYWLRFRIAAVALANLFAIWFGFYWKLIGPVAHY